MQPGFPLDMPLTAFPLDLTLAALKAAEGRATRRELHTIVYLASLALCDSEEPPFECLWTSTGPWIPDVDDAIASLIASGLAKLSDHYIVKLTEKGEKKAEEVWRSLRAEEREALLKAAREATGAGAGSSPSPRRRGRRRRRRAP